MGASIMMKGIIISILFILSFHVLSAQDSSKIKLRGIGVRNMSTRSLSIGYKATALNYNVSLNDCVVEVTATGKTVTLPTAVGITGMIFTIALTASGSGTIATTSSQNINGSTTYSLVSQYKYCTVISNNVGWVVIANN